MEINDHIQEIQKGIREGLFPNEASVSQGIVLRILQSLNWPTYDTQVVWPEYTLEGKRVDFALCHPVKKPVIFIEVKMIGKRHKAEKQLFEYAFHIGVQMAILTDGPEWHFFLPGEKGLYLDRRLYKLDLLERDIEEISKRFQRYLSYELVCTKKALEVARSDYRDVIKQRDLKETLPLAWSKLISEPDDLLVDLLINKVESLCGFKPDESLIATFLADRELVSKPFLIDSSDSHAAFAEETDPSGRAQASSGRDDLSKYESPFHCVDRKTLPAGLADVLEVCLEMYENGRGYNNAVRVLFDRRKLKSIHTIYDKCTRAIDLDTVGFKELANDKEKIAAYLQTRYPKYDEDIIKCLGTSQL